MDFTGKLDFVMLHKNIYHEAAELPTFTNWYGSEEKLHFTQPLKYPYRNVKFTPASHLWL